VVVHSKTCQVWLHSLNSAVGAAKTYSGREFHGLTTRTTKLNFLTTSRNCCYFAEHVVSMSDFVFLLFGNVRIPSQTSES